MHDHNPIDLVLKLNSIIFSRFVEFDPICNLHPKLHIIMVSFLNLLVLYLFKSSNDDHY